LVTRRFEKGAIVMTQHFRKSDLPVDPARMQAVLQSGGTFRVTVAEALAFQALLTGAVWGSEVIRMTTGLAHVMAGGGKLGIPVRLLAGFGTTLVFQPGYHLGVADALPAAQVIVIIAAATVMGVALGYLGDAELGHLVLWVTLHDDLVMVGVGGQS
jgi:hypothetical protein